HSEETGPHNGKPTTHSEETEPHEPPHNGKPITRIEISPSGTYLVTYSEIDSSIIGWNVHNENYDEKSDKDEGRLEMDKVKPFELDKNVKINHLCVSDNKEIAYIVNYKNWNCLSK